MLPTSDSHLSNLTKDIEYYYHRSRPYPLDINEKEKLCKYIEHCVQYLQSTCTKQASKLNTKSKSNKKAKCRKTQRIFLENMKERKTTSNSNWTIHKFGSESWGTSIGRQSDIDIAVRLNFRNSRSDKIFMLGKLSKIISERDTKGILRVQILLHAKYPIIRVYHTQYQHIKADISIADRFCLKRNRLIIEYANYYEFEYKLPIKKLIVFIKYWSKQRGINGAYYGYLNSFGYTLMILHFIQYYIYDDAYEYDCCLSKIVLRLFEFYAYKYNQCLDGIAIDSALFKKHDTQCFMEVIDPVNAHNNVAKNVGYVQSRRIQTEFIRAVAIIRNYNGLNGSLFDELTGKYSDDGHYDSSVDTNDSSSTFDLSEIDIASDSKSIGTKQ